MLKEKSLKKSATVVKLERFVSKYLVISILFTRNKLYKKTLSPAPREAETVSFVARPVFSFILQYSSDVMGYTC